MEYIASLRKIQFNFSWTFALPFTKPMLQRALCNGDVHLFDSEMSSIVIMECQ